MAFCTQLANGYLNSRVLHTCLRPTSRDHLLILSSTAPSRRQGRSTRKTRSVSVTHVSEARSDTTSPSEPTAAFLGYDRNFCEKYDLGKKLGSGAWGTVYLATCKETGLQYACKVVEKWIVDDGTLASGFAHRMQMEIDMANRLKNSLNVVTLHEVLEDDRNLYMVTELCTGGELCHRIKAGRYSERDAAQIIRDIVQLVAQCHKKNVILRDVKPENLLFLNDSNDSPLKAIDFGIARPCQPGEYLLERCGSPVYVAPEVLQKHYTRSADMWSAGIIAYMLLTGRLPWKGEAGITVAQLYDGGDGPAFSRRDAFKALMFDSLDFESHPWDVISADARDLVSSMLQKDPKQRITAKDALKNRWLQVEGEGAASDRPFEDTIIQRLQQFGTYGRLKQAALRKLVSSIPSASKAGREFQDAFASGDSDSVSYNSLLQVLLAKGFCLTDTEGHHLMSLLDADGDGSIDEEDWVAATVDWQKVQQSDEWGQWVDSLFHAVDLDPGGTMEVADLKEILLSAPCHVDSELEEEASLRELGAGPGQRVCVETFKRMLVHTTSEDDLDMFDTRLDKNSVQSSTDSQ